MTSIPSPISHTSTTALLLVDNQLAFRHPTHWGPSRSNLSYETNLPTLISAFRSPASSSISKPQIIHIEHLSQLPQSALHPDYVGEPGSGFEGRHGVDLLPFAEPRDGETVITKGVNSAFIGTELEKQVLLRPLRPVNQGAY